MISKIRGNMSDETKQCPYCGETININAKKCRFCGEWLNEETPEEPKNINCPYCGEEILSTDKKCKFCGEVFENSTLEASKFQNINNDPLLKIITWNNVTMIFWGIMMGIVMMPAWLLLPFELDVLKSFKFEKIKIKNYCNAEIFGKICKQDKIAPSIIFAINDILFVINIFMLSMGLDIIWWSGYVFITTFISLAVIEIKYAKGIEEHIFKQYGLNIKLNKVLVFLFQSIYLNYFFLTYKERLEKARKI